MTIYFPVCKHSTEDYKDESITHIILTGEEPVWEPSEDSFAVQEEAMPNFGVLLVEQEAITRGHRIINHVSTTSEDFNVIDSTYHDNFYEALVSTVKVSSKVSKVGVSRVDFSKGKKRINHQTLSKNCMVSPEMALRTVKRTTRRGIRTVLHTSLYRFWRSNYHQLRYRRLIHHVYIYTLKAGTNSRSGNVFAKAYTTNFHWCRSIPMKINIEAHKTFSLLFQQDGVPPRMIMDGSKEQTLGKSRKKFQ